jgi:hypothetical protein
MILFFLVLNASFYYFVSTDEQFVNSQSKIAKVHDAPVSGGLGYIYPGGFGFGQIPGPSSSLFWRVLLLLLRFSAQLTWESYYNTS